MSIPQWNPKSEYSAEERKLLDELERVRKLYRFFREHRDAIFDEEMKRELASMYSKVGKERKPPAMMAMATLLQGYADCSDAEAVQLTVFDKRWQLVLDCLGRNEPLFGQGTLQRFRQRLIDHDMDRTLLEKTIEVARETGDFDWRKLPNKLSIAIDSSGYEGAGKVEDTFNLIAHAMNKVLDCVTTVSGWEFEEICEDAELSVLMASSPKAALDRNWSKEEERNRALEELMEQVDRLKAWLDNHGFDSSGIPCLEESMSTLHEVIDQDIEIDSETGQREIRDEVAEDRRISIEDEHMRHGRKSSSQLIDGFKRHLATDLATQLILGCAIRPANRADGEVLEELRPRLEKESRTIGELHVDRGYLGSSVIDELDEEGAEIVSRAWPLHNQGQFTKDEFDIDLEEMAITCPNDQTQPIKKLGTTVAFDAEECDSCPLRDQCTRAAKGRGRSVQIADDEPLQQKFREAERTPEGREQLRERAPVEHRLSHLGQRQGDRARYKGLRNNLFDIRRAASIQNLETAQRAAA